MLASIMPKRDQEQNSQPLPDKIYLSGSDVVQSSDRHHVIIGSLSAHLRK
ncbi:MULTISPECIES: hypothetical protein [Anoxybacillus]|nr:MULTISPECIES: hypothetical protein [Anoxybacillus]